MLELDNVGHVRYANPAAAKLLGYDIEELPGLDYRVLINTQTDDDNKTDPVRRVRYTTDIMRGVGALLRRKNGQFRPVEYRIVPVTEQGATVGTVLVFHDVGERVRLDNLLKDMQTTARIGGWEYDVETHKMHWTEALYAIHDLPFGQPIELESSRNMFHPEDRKKLIEASQHAIDTGASSDLHLRLTSARGRQLWVRMIIKAERRNGKIVRLHGTLQDVTDRVVAERQLRETRDFFELTLNAVPTPINYFNRDFDHDVREPRVRGVARRLPRDEAARQAPARAAAHRHVRARDALRGQGDGAASACTPGTPPCVTASCASGRTITCRRSTPTAPCSASSRSSTISPSSERLEARLLQAQKMEAIGQLTGGIAHDFNNLLGVVIGNLQLLERSVAETPTLARKVHTAMRAAVRGADLTRRLLAFARRQILDPAVVDANRQLSGLTELMQRTLGESVEVRMVQAHDLWHTRVDAGQFENAILNLAINARDAMPEGGRLTVRTQQRLPRFDFLQRPPGDRAGRVRVDQRQRHRRRHRARRAQARVRAVLHDQGVRARAAASGSRWSTASPSSPAASRRSRARSASGTTVTILLPRCMEEQTRARGHDRHEDRAGRQRDDPRRRGRCRSARDGRHRAGAARLPRAVGAERRRGAAHSRRAASTSTCCSPTS